MVDEFPYDSPDAGRLQTLRPFIYTEPSIRMNSSIASAQRPLDRSRHAAPQVFERLREMIISMELTPGTVLSRAELAEQFGISQTPVRDALQRLGDEGLVDIFPQHATVVRPVEVALARQAHFLRHAIELEIVRKLATDPDPELVKQLKRSLAQQKLLAETDDYDAFSRADVDFHQMMYDAAKVPDLFRLVRSQSGHLDRLRRLHLPAPGKAQQILRDHTAMVNAIARADPEAAAHSVSVHLSGTLSQIDAIRLRFPEFLRG
jgi:DNA-binding GntR family transcriptional regulator